jgi:hypothetical protein
MPNSPLARQPCERPWKVGEHVDSCALLSCLKSESPDQDMICPPCACATCFHLCGAISVCPWSGVHSDIEIYNWIFFSHWGRSAGWSRRHHDGHRAYRVWNHSPVVVAAVDGVNQDEDVVCCCSSLMSSCLPLYFMSLI